MAQARKLDAERICRVCLREHNELFLIYDETPVEQGMNIVQILNECTRYTVERFDKMPHQMCAGCIAEARAAYRFKRTADEAYRTLVGMLGRIPRRNKDNCVDSGTQTEQSTLYPCEMCEEKLFSMGELRQHRNNVHQSELKCKVCGKVYEQLRLLQMHLAQAHDEHGSVSAHLQCKQCERVFSRRDHLVRHKRNVHHQQIPSRSKTEQQSKVKVEKPPDGLSSLLEEPEMVVMADATDKSLDNYWMNNMESDDATELGGAGGDCQTNPISSDDEAKPDDIDINHKLWVALEPEVNMDLSSSQLDEKEEREEEEPIKKKLKRKRAARKNKNYNEGYDDDAGDNDESTDNNGDDDDGAYDPNSDHDHSSDDEDELFKKTAAANTKNDMNIQIKTEPLEFEGVGGGTALDTLTNTGFTLKREKVEIEEQLNSSVEPLDAIDVNKSNSNANESSEATTTGGNESSKAKTTKVNKPKVEIVREYLQKKRSPRRHRRDDNPENRCDLCQRTFSRHCHLLRHKLSHLEQKPHACPHCPKTFARSDHLKAHVLSLHGTRDFKCTICDAAFTRADALERHKVSKHDGAVLDGSSSSAAGGLLEAKLHACEYCEKKFTSKSYLRKHTLIHTDLLYACKNCDLTFKERQQLREHEKTHTSERNFLCCICGDSFARNDYLRVHMRRHNGEKPYKCKYCGKGFPRATDVKVHERYHTGTKPNLCTLCGKGFHRAYNLTIHMRTHTGERPYKCDQCPKSFTQSNDLKAHIRRHTGERYKCNECDACFLQLYAMRHHALSVHGTHIESKTGRLQRTGLYDDPSIQPQITTVLVAPQNYEASTHQAQPPPPQPVQATTTAASTTTTATLIHQQQQQQHHQQQSLSSPQLHGQHSQDTGQSYASSTIETVVVQPMAAAQLAVPGHEYLAPYLHLPSAIVRIQQSINHQRPVSNQEQQQT